MTTNSHRAPYGPTFKAWAVKQLGPQPTEAQLATAHAFGRPGKQSLALAMAMRECGVTAAQIIMACGAPQNNHRRAEIAAGHFKRDMVAPDTLGHTVYKVAITPKGEKAIEARKAAAEKAALAPAEKPAKAPRKRGNKPAVQPVIQGDTNTLTGEADADRDAVGVHMGSNA